MRLPTAAEIITGAGVGLLATQAVAQDLSQACIDQLSDAPMSIVVPNSAGGGYDTYARALAPPLAEAIGTHVRVVNMPGGGGLIASTEVARQGDDEILMLLDNFIDIVTNTDAVSNDVTPDDFAAVALVVSEPRAWIGPPDLDLSDPELTTLIASGGTLQSSILDIGLVARALGLDVRVIAGYEGTSDNTAAVLRGEVDFTSQSMGSALRNLSQNGLTVAAVLDDQPAGAAPEAPLVGGDAGLVMMRAAGLSDEERQARMDAARAAISLSSTQRGLVTSAAMSADRLDCLRQAVWAALHDPAFAEATGAQGREIDPLGWEDAELMLSDARDAWMAVAPEADALMDAIRP